MPGAPLPLSHLKVLDLTRVLAGPYCTMVLGDLGASVLKVERPGTGDETRGWGPPFDEDGASAYFLSVNRNKLSLALDFDEPTDRDMLSRLIGQADVVVENFRPGSLERRGIIASQLLEKHPELLWCRLTGFAFDAHRPAYDAVIQAECGWMAITGERDGAPMKVGVALADVGAGKDAAIAILARLASRRGLAPDDRLLSVSLSHSATAALVNVAQNRLVTGAEPGRWGNSHPNLVPYQMFETADRPIVLAVGTDAQWLACCAALDRADLAAEARYARNAGRVGNRGELVAAVGATLLGGSAAHWLGRLRQAEVPSGIVRLVSEALADVEADALSGVSPPPPGAVRLPPPRLDQHGQMVRAHGWAAFAIAERT